MTWFEVEQIGKYLDRLELQLDQWRLGRHQMMMEKAELARAINKAESVLHKDISNPVMRDYMIELHRRSDECRHRIQERLKLR